jgi:F0F1-type ATP synthase assembly protein I
MAGAVLFPAGIALLLLNGPAYEFAAAGGGLIVLVATAMFTWIVFRTAHP